MNYKPNFLGIGTQHSGTTWFAGCLQQHPEISMRRKELHFFNKCYETKGWDWYSSYFTKQEGFTAYGEWTPEYIFDDNATIRICKDLKDIKILCLFRNPVDRMYSQYWRHRAAGFTYLDFFETIKRHDLFIRRSTYTEDWKRYLTQFGEQNCFPLIFENVIEDPRKYFHDTFAFLCVDTDFFPDISISQKNSLKFNKYQKVTDLLTRCKFFLRSIGAREFVELIKRSGIKNILEAANRKERTYPVQLSRTDRKYILDKYFQSDIDNFSRLTGMDLNLWQ